MSEQSIPFFAICMPSKVFCIISISKQSLKPWNYWKIPAHLCWMTVVVVASSLHSSSFTLYSVSYPNFVQGQSFAKMRIFSDQVELLNINRYAIHIVLRCYGKKWARYFEWWQFLSTWGFFSSRVELLNINHGAIHRVSGHFRRKWARNSRYRPNGPFFYIP